MSQVLFAEITEETQRELCEACRMALPKEICGIMFGRLSEQKVTADGFAIVRNIAPDPATSFSFAPVDWIEAFYQSQKNERNIVGFFHSHPGGSVSPSSADAAGWLPWGTYWIVAQKTPACKLAVYVPAPSNTWRQLALASV